jgi:oligopeptide transport system substrate-binding protein
MGEIENPANAVSRTAIKQVLWLSVLATVGFILLMGLLSWASDLTGSGPGTLSGIDADTGTVTLVLAQEPPQLDSTRATDQVSGMILGHVMEGLLRYDEHQQLEAAVAERWDLRETGATFWLREDARWSDGQPVTAHDFVFAWQTALDPATASEYAFILYPLKNAEAINTGQSPRDQLGARAISDWVLEVELEQPTAHFSKLVAFPTYFPIREDFYRGRDGRYGSDAIDLLYNGPFQMTRWVHGAHVRLEKNPHYWDAERIHINVLDMPYVTSDTTAAVNLFKQGAIATTGLDAEALENALKLRWNISRYQDGSVFYLDFNFRPERLTSNHSLRKALELVNDPSELVYKVIKIPGYQPGVSLFPAWLNGVNGLFRQEYPPPTTRPNLEEARRYLELAKQELDVDEIPPLVLLTGDSPFSNKHAEYYQNLVMRTLGLEVKIDKQIFKQRIAKMSSGDFDLVAAGWGPDFDDPLTFADLYASWNRNNRGGYNNPELDRLVRVAQNSIDPKTRMDAFGEIQNILHEDVVLLHNYERGIVYVQDPRLRGVVRRAIGTDPDYTNAFIIDTP